MKWDCEQIQARLDAYLEGALAPAEMRQADAHASTCPDCGEWYEARLATLWMQRLEPLESPPGLETRILAQTTAPPSGGFSLWSLVEQGWNLLSQPRFAFGLAATLFSVFMVLNATGVSLRNLDAADLSPVNLYHAADRQAHLAYARGVRFVNELRFVYEIRARLEEFRGDSAEPSTDDSSREQKKKEEEKKNFSRGTSEELLAYQQVGFLRTLR